MKKKIIYSVLFLLLFLVFTDNVLALGFSSNVKVKMCGFDGVPNNLPKFTSGMYNLIKILTPIILIVMGMIDFVNATMANDEQKMKKAQKKFITRLLAAIFVFLVMSIVQFVFRNLSSTEGFDGNVKNGFSSCMNCVLNNKCSAATSKTKKSCQSLSEDKCTKDDYGQSCEKYKSGGRVKCRLACSNYKRIDCIPTKTGYCSWNVSKKKCMPLKTENIVVDDDDNSGTTGGNTSGNISSNTSGNTSGNVGTKTAEAEACYDRCSTMKNTSAKTACEAACKKIENNSKLTACDTRGITKCTSTTDSDGFACEVKNNSCRTKCESIKGSNNSGKCEQYSYCKWTGSRCANK